MSSRRDPVVCSASVGPSGTLGYFLTYEMSMALKIIESALIGALEVQLQF